MFDTIYLLSKDEYEKYKNRISFLPYYWWLRTPYDNESHVMIVNNRGIIRSHLTYFNFTAVRPVIEIPHGNLHDIIGARITKYNFPWIVIDDNLAIAEIPITFMNFGKDEIYETSYVREFLLDWIKNR